MEKSILFNTEDVQAILEGRKTSTRRIVKPQPNQPVQLGFISSSTDAKREGCYGWGKDKYGGIVDIAKPPYKPGDILYIRETFFEGDILDSNEDIIDRGIVLYAADELREDIDPTEMKWRPSIHMPKRLARIFLKVTDVKVQRLQDITEDEAEAEGIKSYTKDERVYKYAINDDWWIDYCNKRKKPGTWWQRMPKTATEAFKYLWDSYYDWPKCWEFNPYIFVIEFENIDNYKLK